MKIFSRYTKYFPKYVIDIDLAKLFDARVAKVTDNDGNQKECIIIPTDENGIFKNKNGFFHWRFAVFKNLYASQAKKFFITHHIPKSCENNLKARGIIEDTPKTEIIGGLYVAKPAKSRKKG